MTETQAKNPKQEAILDGAIAEFLSHGYAAASMDRIAATAGVSKATVYSHFQSKENLFVALIERLVADKFALLLNPRMVKQQLDSPPRLFLQKVAQMFLEQPGKDPEVVNFLRMVIGESGRFPELARAFVSALTATGLRSITFYFENCPQLQIADPEATARIFIGAIAHFVLTQRVLYGAEIIPLSEERFVNTLVNLIVQE
jgi:AcrR family transcriptional regulator